MAIILIIEENEAIQRYLEFRMADYDVLSAPNGHEALILMDFVSPDLVIADLSLPESAGLEFLAALRMKSRAMEPEVIVLTERDDVRFRVSAARLGTLEVLVKPVPGDALFASIGRRMPAQRRRRSAGKAMRQSVGPANQASLRLNGFEEAVDSLAAVLDARDGGIQSHHSLRVSRYALHLAREMNLSKDACEVIRRSGLLHDVGMMGLAGPVSQISEHSSSADLREGRKHPQTGYVILKGMGNLNDEAAIVRAHHERYDGSGYPRGLHGKHIHWGARLLGLIDSFDAITSGYSTGLRRPHAQAALQIAAGAGTYFDPEIVRAFLAVRPIVWERIATETDIWRAGVEQRPEFAAERNMAPEPVNR